MSNTVKESFDSLNMTQNKVVQKFYIIVSLKLFLLVNDTDFKLIVLQPPIISEEDSVD